MVRQAVCRPGQQGRHENAGADLVDGRGGDEGRDGGGEAHRGEAARHDEQRKRQAVRAAEAMEAVEQKGAERHSKADHRQPHPARRRGRHAQCGEHQRELDQDEIKQDRSKQGDGDEARHRSPWKWIGRLERGGAGGGRRGFPSEQRDGGEHRQGEAVDRKGSAPAERTERAASPDEGRGEDRRDPDLVAQPSGALGTVEEVADQGRADRQHGGLDDAERDSAGEDRPIAVEQQRQAADQCVDRHRGEQQGATAKAIGQPAGERGGNDQTGGGRGQQDRHAIGRPREVVKMVEQQGQAGHQRDDRHDRQARRQKEGDPLQAAGGSRHGGRGRGQRTGPSMLRTVSATKERVRDGSVRSASMRASRSLNDGSWSSSAAASTVGTNSSITSK